MAVPGDTKLSALISADQATTVCGRITANVGDLDWMGAGAGFCSLQALKASSSMCAADTMTCVMAANDPSPPCSIDAIPKCADVTVDQFVDCRSDYLMGFVNYYVPITCSTDPGIAPQATPGSCVTPYASCPDLMP